jgi:hypothetical protein
MNYTLKQQMHYELNAQNELILINQAIQKLMFINLYAWKWPRNRVKTCNIANKHK